VYSFTKNASTAEYLRTSENTVTPLERKIFENQRKRDESNAERSQDRATDLRPQTSDLNTDRLTMMIFCRIPEADYDFVKFRGLKCRVVPSGYFYQLSFSLSLSAT
jgi:hypothetical protein